MRKQRNAARTVTSTNQSLTIYNQGFAVVHETRRLRFCLGSNEIQLEGMPQQYMINSMNILSTEGDAEMTVTGISFEAATLNTAQIMANLEGHDVELMFRSSNGRERWTKGKVLHYLTDKVLIEKAGGKTSLVTVADIVEVSFDAKAIEDLSDSNTIVLSADGTAAGGADVRVLYKTAGITWRALHFAIYDEKAEVLTLFHASAAIDNRSGAGFSGDLTLSAANLPNQDGREMVYAQAAMAPMGGGAKRANVRSARIESVGEAKTYTVPGKVTINKNTTNKQVPLGSWQNVPVRREYFVPALPFYTRANNDSGLESVSIRLCLVNDAANNLGVPLPAGDVEIYQLDSAGKPQPTGGDTIDHIGVGETFGLVYTKTDDVKVERKLVESVEGEEQPAALPVDGPVMRPLAGAAGGPHVGEPMPRPDVVRQPVEAVEARKYRDETWEVTVHNFKTDGTAVSVSVFEELQGKHQILNSTHDFKPERANRYSAPVNAAAGDKGTLRYTVRIWED